MKGQSHRSSRSLHVAFWKEGPLQIKLLCVLLGIEIVTSSHSTSKMRKMGWLHKKRYSVQWLKKEEITCFVMLPFIFLV